MKKIIIIITTIILFGAVGFFVVNKLQKNGDVYQTQLLCEKMTSAKCSFGMCENNCGARGRWKGWVPVSSIIQQNKPEGGRIKSCMEKYPKVDFGDCVPGKAADGWSQLVLYPNSADTKGLKGAPDMFVPKEIQDAGVASYGNSVSSCKTDWNIRRYNKYVGASQEEFCEFIVDYNENCDSCLLEWQGGCC